MTEKDKKEKKEKEILRVMALVEISDKNKVGKACAVQPGKSKKKNLLICSDTGNRTPSCRVRDGDVNHYTISDVTGR